MSTIKILAQLEMQLGECPRWNEQEESWYWVDILGKALYRYDTLNKKLFSRIFDFNPACFAFTKTNQIILTASSGLFLLENFSSAVQFIMDPESDQPTQRFNDGVPTPDGNLLAGTIGDATTATGNLYYFDITKNSVICETIMEGYTIINGQAFSPDGKWLYITDTPKQKILKYPYNSTTKKLGKAQLFYKFTQEDEYPDGAAVDAEGNYWIAMYGTGKICVISPEGEKIDEIYLPISQPTMIAFGGINLNQLIVTSAAQGLNKESLEKEPLAGSVLLLDISKKGALPFKLNTYKPSAN